MSFIETTYTINGYEVHARYTQSSVDSLFLPLLEHLRNIQREKQGRIVVFLVAPPCVGKTTLSMFLQDLSKRVEGKCIQAIGMDGFHRYQSYLTTHTMVRDNKEVSMVSLKGCPETFDLEKLRDKIIQLTKEAVVKWPNYVRSLHNPVEDQIEVTSDIVLLEGNYLLLEDEGWRDLVQYCDYSVFISTKLAYIENRLIERKMLSGMDKEEAYTFFKKSDAYNAEYILKHSQKADVIYVMDNDGNYHEARSL